MDFKYNFTFDNTEKPYWLRRINEIYREVRDEDSKCLVLFDFSNEVKITDLQPLHLVTFACLIQYLDNLGCQVCIAQDNRPVYEYLFDELKFPEYWRGGKNHVETETFENIFNLWRIIDAEKDLYAKNVEIYLKKNFFADKDLSSVSLSMVEAFYNVFDHAEADNNAFSLIRYDEKMQTLHVAIADFGIGIVTSVRNFDNSVKTDVEALDTAIRNNFTVKSTSRNRGFGLDNILGCCDKARIFSGSALLIKIGDKIKTISTTFPFKGTLIYFEVNLSNLEDEEIIEELDW